MAKQIRKIAKWNNGNPGNVREIGKADQAKLIGVKGAGGEVLVWEHANRWQADVTDHPEEAVAYLNEEGEFTVKEVEVEVEESDSEIQPSDEA